MSDLTFAYSQLKKFNNFILGEQELKKFFVLGENNFLEAYQELIFSDILSFSKKNFYSDSSNSIDLTQPVDIPIRIRQIVSIIISTISYLFLVVTRRAILISTADKNTFKKYQCDFRMANLFRYLFERNIPFFEFFHVIFREDFVSSALKRRRVAIYLEGIDVLYKFLTTFGLYQKKNKLSCASLDFSSTKEDAKLFYQLIVKYANRTNQSHFRIRFIHLLLRFTNIRVLIASADPRNYNELVEACRLSGIRSYGFQSGNISKYNFGYLDNCSSGGRLMRPDIMVVETGYWKNELLRLGTYFKEDEIKIGGSLKEDYRNDFVPQVGTIVGDEVRDKDRKDKSITILIPYEIVAPKDEILTYIKKFLTYQNIKVVFKFRADRNLRQQILEYGLSDIPRNLVLITDLKEIDDFDIVAGTYSTFLYEAIGRLKPVMFLKTSLDYGEGMIINDLALMLDKNDSDFYSKLVESKKTSVDTLIQRRDRLYADTRILASTLDDILKV